MSRTSSGSADDLTPGVAIDRVEAVKTYVVALPLSRPLKLDQQVVSAREYVVLELCTAQGLVGYAVGLTRGLPVPQMLDGLAPELVGVDPSRRRAVLDGIVRRHPNAALTLTRATSLIDVALWDLLAKRARMPLWRLLGGWAPRVPIVAVGGYFAEERSPADLADELCALEDQGFGHLKIHAPGDLRLLADLRSKLATETQLAVDLGMRFRDLDSAGRACRALDGIGLWFIEDPFPPDFYELTAALAQQTGTPIAAGEDACGREMLVRTAAAADVLRVDATASGGIDVVLSGAEHAASRGRPVMTHSFLELHGQVAGGMATVAFAETVPYGSGANPFDQLLESTQAVERGELVLSEHPGNGLRVDHERVRHLASWGSVRRG